MTSMRLILAAAVLAGVVASAPVTCDAATTSNNLYGMPSGTCTQWATCTSTFCTSMGANSTSDLTCLGNATSASNCTALAAALKTYVTCLNAAAFADSCQPGTTAFGELGMGLAGVMGASEYAGSTVQMSCMRTVCVALNESGRGDACSTEVGATNYSSVCMYDASNESNTTPAPPAPTNPTTPAPGASGAASVSTAVLAVLATVALLL